MFDIEVTNNFLFKMINSGNSKQILPKIPSYSKQQGKYRIDLK